MFEYLSTYFWWKFVFDFWNFYLKTSINVGFNPKKKMKKNIL